VSDAAFDESHARPSPAEAGLAELLARVATVEHERDEYRKLYLLLREENERLKRGLVGQKAERLPLNDAQLSLAMLGLMLGNGESPAGPPKDETEQEIPAHTRRVPKRRTLPAEWPRVTIELIPPEVEREGLDAFEMIGEERRGVLERRPASCVVVEVVRRKFRRKTDKDELETEVLIAEPLSLPIDRASLVPACWRRRSSSAGAIICLPTDRRPSTPATASSSLVRRSAAGTSRSPTRPCRSSRP
jgi:transposase